MRGFNLSSFNEENLAKQAIKTKKDAISFLNDTKETKSFHDHLLPWLIQFNIIPSDEKLWPESLNKLIENYKNCVSKYAADGEEPDTAALEKKLEDIVPRDLGRSLKIFTEMMSDLKINEAAFPNPSFRFHRIFVILRNEIPKFSYLQGNDRFVYISTIVSLLFCSQFEVQPDVAEAFGYHVSKHLLEKLAFGNAVLDPDESFLVFNGLSELIAKATPATYSAFNSQGLKPEMYALNWYLLLFADQYEIDQLLVVWDHLFLNVDKFQNYVTVLCASHLNQIQIGNNVGETMQRILKARDFNLTRLFNDAERIQNRKDGTVKTVTVPSSKTPGWVIILIILILIIIVIIMYVLLK